MAIPYEADLNDTINNDIQLKLSDDEYSVLPLSKGDTAIDVPILNFASKQAMTKGTIVLLADLQSHRANQGKFYQLAKTLPNWGWNTILVTPHTDYFVFPPDPQLENAAQDENSDGDASDTQSADAQADDTKADDTKADETQSTNSTLSQTVSENNIENAATAADKQTEFIAQQTELKSFELQQAELGFNKQDYANFIDLLLQKIDSRFLQQPGYRLLMVEGKTATIAIALLNENSELDINGLVLNNPYWPETAANSLIPKQIAQLPLPVLDLLSLSDSTWSRQTEANRLIQTRVRVKSYYRQREIIGGHFDALANEYIAKEVIGWTRYLGW